MQNINKLSLKQNKTLEVIKSFWNKQRFFPSTREIAKALKIQSPNTIFSHLKALEKKGYLQKNAKGKIINISDQAFQFDHQLSPLFPLLPSSYSIPFFSESIPAGFQSPAEEVGKEMITIDQYVIKNPNNTFALKVRGNSMETAGIMPGDLILVEKRADAKPGQIVVAHLPDGFTVKRLINENNSLYLKAESTQDYQIKLTEGTELWGVVVGVIRKYNNS